eukprot:5354775-Ditylum_brightwellii.AAC.1
MPMEIGILGKSCFHVLVPPQVGTMANMVPSVEDITKVFPKTFIPEVPGEPDCKSLYEVHCLLMKNAALIEIMLRGGLHSHLGLVFTPGQYLQLTGNAFVPLSNPRPSLIMPNPFMTAADAETVRQNHRVQLASYHKFLNTDKALKTQLLSAVND